jgi:hypothetical protein
LVDAIYKVIKEIVPYLRYDLLEYLMSKIEQLPIKEFDGKVLRLLRKLLMAAVNNVQYLKVTFLNVI